MKCVECGVVIPPVRLAALPGTRTCVGCSRVKASVGITVWDKAGPSLVVADAATAERHRALERSDGRDTRLK